MSLGWSRHGKKWVGFGVEAQVALDSDRDGLGMGLSGVGMGCRWARVAGPTGLGFGVGTEMGLK